MIGSEKQKMGLVPVLQITISRLLQNGSGSEQACPSSYCVTSSQQRRRKQEKYKKSIWVRKIVQERQMESEYHLLMEELKLYDHEYLLSSFVCRQRNCCTLQFL
jgi:hypothetical protein